MLGSEDIAAAISQVVEGGVDVDEAGRVNERTCAPAKLEVIKLLVIEYAGDFFHVGSPVDLGVRDFLNDEGAENGVCEHEQDGVGREVCVQMLFELRKPGAHRVDGVACHLGVWLCSLLSHLTL